MIALTSRNMELYLNKVSGCVGRIHDGLFWMFLKNNGMSSIRLILGSGKARVLLIPRSSIFLEKLVVAQPLMTFPTTCCTRVVPERCVVILAGARLWCPISHCHAVHILILYSCQLHCLNCWTYLHEISLWEFTWKFSVSCSFGSYRPKVTVH
jgi:hypothetical protein